MNLRDPVIYRILRASHHRTGDDWCIYPMYDWAHGQSDSIERITHSLCTLEFEDHRPLYDWFLDQLEISSATAQQIEFARLNLSLHDAEQAQAAAPGRPDGHRLRAGTTRACRRCPACADADITPEAIRDLLRHDRRGQGDSLVDVACSSHCDAART